MATINGKKFTVGRVESFRISLIGPRGAWASLVRNQIGVWFLVTDRGQWQVRQCEGVHLP